MTYRELDLVRVFDAPRELVWQAWTDPDQLAQWWGPAGIHTPRESIEMDVRPGGVFRLTMVMDDGSAEFPSDMRYTVVEPMDRLGHAWEGQRGLGGGESTMTFKDLDGTKTELTMNYAGYATEVMAGFMVQGTGQQLDKLATFVTR